MIEVNRRSLIAGLASLIAAPAIVRASSLMPIRSELGRMRLHTVVGTFWGKRTDVNVTWQHYKFRIPVLTYDPNKMTVGWRIGPKGNFNVILDGQAFDLMMCSKPYWIDEARIVEHPLLEDTRWVLHA